jgi:alkylation response protein AidB-like acyl-CoA dehydrogenase
MTASITDVAAVVDEVLPLVRERRDEIRNRRRLPDDLELALRATGINRMALPASLGGFETPAAEMLAVFERIAAADGSTGWCAVIGGASNIFAGYLPKAGARDIFVDADRSSATMFSPLGMLAEERDGSLHLDGRWPFVSNCLHAAWIGLGARMRRRGDVEPRPQLVFAPAAEITIEDTWDAVGMSGTGSHHVRAEHVRIDRSHFCEFVGTPWPDAPLWRMPVFSVILPLLAAVPLGIARGALDELARQARDGRAGVRRTDLASDPLAMADYAAAAARLDAARGALIDLVRRAHEQVSCGDLLGPCQLARIYLANLHATETAVEVTAVAHRLGGGAAAYGASPLLHALNDVYAARQHYQFAHEHRSALGRVLAGVDETYPPYIT